jgi:hypothetical protein
VICWLGERLRGYQKTPAPDHHESHLAEA